MSPSPAAARLLSLLFLLSAVAWTPSHARIGISEATLWFRADLTVDAEGRRGVFDEQKQIDVGAIRQVVAARRGAIEHGAISAIQDGIRLG